MQIRKTDVLIIVMMIVLLSITIVGATSFNTGHPFLVTNQYGHQVEMFGSGIYANDSYFRAPIFIGSDLTMLVLVLPMLLFGFVNNLKKRSNQSQLFLASSLAVVLYYATSIAFGVTYNVLHLLYIVLFSSALIGLIATIRMIDSSQLVKQGERVPPTRGLTIFLVLSGTALFGAWLPDIIPTILAQSTLPLIEVYTTEITYVLDMGIISPMIFICLHLLRKGDGFGYILLAITLTLCGVMGLMLPLQTMFQLLAGIEIPIPVLATKVGIFVILAAFAVFFNQRLYRKWVG